MDERGHPMKYVRLGNSGLKVSQICLGVMSYGTKDWREWILTEDEARPFYELALESGINFFDSAESYSNGVSEEILGRAIKDLVPNREDVVLATKVFGGTGPRGANRVGLSRKHIMAACDDSLKRLGTDYIDLYIIHRHDPSVPMEETLEALSDLVRVGKVRYIGASSMYAWQFLKYLNLSEKHGFSQFVSMQNHYNLQYREEEREMNPLCVAEGVGLTPWSPLARGLLARRTTSIDEDVTTRAKTDEFGRQMYYAKNDFDISARNADLADKLGVSPAQTALAWMLSKPGIAAPIIGATKIHHLEQAVASVELELSNEDIASLEELYQPHPVLGFL